MAVIEVEITDENKVGSNIGTKDENNLKIKISEKTSSSPSAFYCPTESTSESVIVPETNKLNLDLWHSNRDNTSTGRETSLAHVDSEKLKAFLGRNTNDIVPTVFKDGKCNSVVCRGSQKLSRARAFLASRKSVSVQNTA